MIRTSALEKLLFTPYSHQLRLSTWAVLDAARDEKIYGHLNRASATTYCLLPGDNAEELADVAPYLVQLSQGSAITGWVLSNWGKSWGIFIKTDEDADKLRQHLYQQTFVSDDKGRGFYLRFYDPRVLISLLPTFSADSMESFFGPVTYFLTENKTADALLSFRRADGRLHQQSLPLDPDRQPNL